MVRLPAPGVVPPTRDGGLFSGTTIGVERIKADVIGPTCIRTRGISWNRIGVEIKKSNGLRLRGNRRDRALAVRIAELSVAGKSIQRSAQVAHVEPNSIQRHT
jgi:hypothetical protein